MNKKQSEFLDAFTTPEEGISKIVLPFMEALE